MTVARRSAGLVVVRQFGGQWRCLVLRAYRNWDLPKGMPEPAEEPLQAALRETAEETGLSALTLPWGDDYRETEPYSRGKIARFYIALSAEGEVSLPVSAELGRPEHHEFRWVPFAAALELLPPRFGPILRWAQSVVEASASACGR
ncbi:NUDIX domain-containing protein [Cupriavidus gilardii]|uniref:NUDIX domain-containing protein n=1 Tax=Cupriavidus gilardii TaxID=82541 RepID=UPI001EE62F89|nr:NUDIX domain-containing protein [Cupriavidus gilardii]MCG5261845.1 NUDIX domain-containing protein [Cupriavidus gilardii]MDF9429791.1 NUDIX domain-containing protein [Cupriavidus gilardii]